MFSFREIKEQADVDFGDTYTDDYTIRSNLQRDKEKEYLEHFDSCPIQTKKEVFNRISDLNPNLLKNIVDNQFYNSNVIDSVACISQSLTTVSKGWETYITSYFTELKNIGANSSSGLAMKTNLTIPNSGKAKSLFVIKAPQDVNNIEELYHEAAVAMISLNKLRSFIPNFACVYGYFKCGSPTLDKNGNALNWCGPNSPVGYVIYENIEDAKTISDTLKNDNLSTEEYLQYLIQFLYALKTANEYCEFTHYDCHDSNVLLKKLKKPSIIKYPDFVGNSDVFIKTDHILTFIDYGMTYIETEQGDKFGFNNFLEQYSIYNNFPFILHDVFKFICFSLYHMKNTPSYDILLKPLLSYFLILEGNDTYNMFINKGINYYYAAPYNNLTNAFNIDNFISYCLRLIRYLGYKSPIVTPVDTDTILSCDYEKCFTFPEVLINSGLDLNKEITPSTDLLTFLEIKDTLTGNELKKYLDDFMLYRPNSKYDLCIKNALDTIEKDSVILNKLVPNPDFDYTKNIDSNKDNNLIIYLNTYSRVKSLMLGLKQLLSLYKPSDKLLQSKLYNLNQLAVKYDTYVNDVTDFISENLTQLRVDRDVTKNNINNNIIRAKRLLNIL